MRTINVYFATADALVVLVRLGSSALGVLCGWRAGSRARFAVERDVILAAYTAKTYWNDETLIGWTGQRGGPLLDPVPLWYGNSASS